MTESRSWAKEEGTDGYENSSMTTDFEKALDSKRFFFGFFTRSVG